MASAYPQWPGFPVPNPARFSARVRPEGVPDFPTQLEEILSHVRRCEKWARLDDRIDLAWKRDGKS